MGKLLPAKEVASRLGVTVGTVRRWVRTGVLEGVACGSPMEYHIDEDEVQAFLHGQELHGNTIEDIGQAKTAELSLLNMALSASTEFIYIFDEQGRYLYASEGGPKVLGFTQNDFIGKTWQELGLPVDFMGPFELHRLQVMQTGKPLLAEVPIPTLMGTRCYEYFLNPILRDDGSVEAVVVSTRDITERKEEEKALYQLGAIVESSGDAIISITLDGTIQSWNSGAQRLYGYKAEEIVDRSLFLLLPEEIHGELRSLLEQIKKGRTWQFDETPRLRKDGRIIYVSLTLSSIRNREGEVVGASIIARDVTAYRQAIEALRQSEEGFRLVTQTIPQIVWTLNPQGFAIYFNRRWFEYTGLSEEESYTGEASLNSVLHPDDVEPTTQLWRAALERGDMSAIEHRMRRFDGAYRWHLTRALPLYNSQGEIFKWFGTSTDIDDQKRVEEQLRESERRKDDFISMASHELKTPLTSIKAFTQILHRMFAREQKPEPVLYLGKMEIQINKLTNLVSDLLDISRIQTGKLSFVEEPVQLDALVREVVENLQPTSSTHAILLSGTTGCTLKGDRDRLGQVLINLITNAIKYSPKADRVEVTLSADEEQALIHVRDYGIGIPRRHQEKIFERFYRVSEEGKTFPGLGIGLYISYEIVRRHGGSMKVESSEGEGSTFTVSLPLTRVVNDLSG